MINKDKVRELVSVFYQNTFKTFYVNSVDGETFIKPVGVFVSLGITTSMETLKYICNVIENNSDKYNAEIAEISSIKKGEQFLNTLHNIKNPKQYKLTEFPSNVLSEDQAKELLSNLKEHMNEEKDLNKLRELAVKTNKLQEQIKKLTETEGWENHLIQEENKNNFKIFHQLVNYKVEGNKEFRIGIYVTDKNV